MKIRSRKTNRNTSYELADFLLKEFSKDKETFIPFEELSCNECNDIEDISNDIDCPKSFLIKFKANNLPDPKAIKAEISGFILSEDLTYSPDKVVSHFKSITENHYNLKVSGDKLRKIGTELHASDANHVNYTKQEVKEYLRSSYQQKEWSKLLQLADRTKWRIFVGKTLKESLISDFGKIDNTGISEAINIDKEGFIKRIKEINSYNGFNKEELTYLAPHI